MLKNILILCFLNSVYCQFFSSTNRVTKTNFAFQWKQIGYDFDGIHYTTDTEKPWTVDGIYFKEDEIEEKDYFFRPYNNVPVGFDVYDKYLYVTVPRRRFGIASTLNYVVNTKEISPLLKPYPNVASVPSLVSVYRPRVDALCKRLWVVDTGLLEVPDNREQVKPPEIIIFDLVKNVEILRYQLKSSDLVNGTTSGLTSITVDVTASTCDDAYAYINDLATGGLIVFSLKQKDSWRFSHPTFTYDVGAAGFKVGSDTINWKDGIFSIALSDPDEKGIRKAYYHPLIATQEFSITTDVLKNKNGDIDKNYKLEGVRGAFSQSGSHDYHSGSRTLFFANVAQDGILCWNIDKPLTSKNTALVAQHHKWLLYVSDLKISKENVFFLVNQMPRFINSGLNATEENYFLIWGKVSVLIEGTVCERNKV